MTNRETRKSSLIQTRLAYTIHRQLIKPDLPELWRCGSCGRPVFEANSKTIEITNTFGVSQESLPPNLAWIRIKCHSCGAYISILFL